LILSNSYGDTEKGSEQDRDMTRFVSERSLLLLCVEYNARKRKNAGRRGWINKESRVGKVARVVECLANKQSVLCHKEPGPTW
jgi:hypothetical protein